MAEAPFSFDFTEGTVQDGALRYLLVRPDVLMGTGRKLGRVADFVQALEESAYANARESFEVYRAQGKLREDDFLERTAEFAARLGWGAWSVVDAKEGGSAIIVRNSPFAAGMGQSDIPVCGLIRGVLRALHRVVLGKDIAVEETQCVSQGAPHCHFRCGDTIESAGADDPHP